MFTIEFRAEGLRELGLQLPDHTTFDGGVGTMLWPGLRLFSSFKNQSADSLMLEAHVFELLGAITRLDPPPEKTPPRWLKRVKDRLHAELNEAEAERLRLKAREEEVARAAAGQGQTTTGNSRPITLNQRIGALYARHGCRYRTSELISIFLSAPW